MQHNKRAGTLYESMFSTEALLRGLDVSNTVGDYSPYDCIIDNGKKLIRIQVKGTKCQQTSGYKITVAKGNSRNQKTLRDTDSFDYLAAVVMHRADAHWYIIPELEIGRVMSIKLFVNPTSKGKYEKYKHGWDLIC